MADRRLRLWVFGGILAASIAVGIVVARSVGLQALLAGLYRLGPWAWAAYVAAVVVGEALWLPRMSLVAAGGLLFGPVAAALLSLTGDLISAGLFFSLARGAGRQAVERRLAARWPSWRLVEHVGRRNGLAATALLRVCPVAHYTAVSYASGLWSVPFGTYIAGTFLGALPGAVLYPALGRAVVEPGRTSTLVSLAFLAVFLIGTWVLGRDWLARARMEVEGPGDREGRPAPDGGEEATEGGASRGGGTAGADGDDAKARNPRRRRA